MSNDNRVPSIDAEAVTKDKQKQLLHNKENMMALLNAIFKYGHLKIPFNTIPGMSMQEIHAAMQAIQRKLDLKNKNKASIVHWLRCGLFDSTDMYIPAALLFIKCFDQHPSSENSECNFREIYYFLYKLMMNETDTTLSVGSAKVLHTALSDIIEDVWPHTQNDLLKYLGNIHNYSRAVNRRTYPGKRKN